MGILAQVKKGIIEQNDFELIFGVPGIGKTTFACDRENVLMMDIENGSTFLNIARLPRPKSFKEVLEQLQELLKDSGHYETLVIDSLDHLEPLVNEAACLENGWKAIEDGAFGKGYAAALGKWNEFLSLLKKLREKMHILLIAHSIVKPINDPMKTQPYDRHEIKLNHRAAALFKEAVDAILFCCFEVNLKENKMGKAKALGEGSRVLLTQSRPSHEAKNRYGLPYRMNLSYEDYKAARASSSIENPEHLRKLIEESAKDLPDLELKEKAMKAMNESPNDSVKLSKILNRIQTILASAG